MLSKPLKIARRFGAMRTAIGVATEISGWGKQNRAAVQRFKLARQG